MPDDRPQEAEAAEQTVDPEFNAGFDQPQAAATKPDEAKPSATKPDAAAPAKPNADAAAKAEADKKAAAEKAKEGKPDDGKGEKPDELTETQKRLNERAAASSITPEQKAEADKAAAEAAAKKEADEKAAAEAAKKEAEAAKPTLVTVPMTLEDALKLPEIAQAKVHITDDDGTEKDITYDEFAKRWPEIAQGNIIATAPLAKAVIENAIKSGQLASPESIAQLESKVGQEIQQMQFMQDLISGTVNDKGEFVEGHPDAKAIVRSPEYKAWIGSQPPGVQALTNSLNPLDAIAILDAYKESIGKKSKADAQAKARAAKEKLDNAHKETLRSGHTVESPAEDGDDFNAGFHEGTGA